MAVSSPIRFGATWWRIALGGAVGAGLRWAVVAATDTRAAFPWPTLLVNVMGCLVIGLLVTAPPARRSTWGLGVAGGLTTFSTFSVELAALLRDDDAAVAAAYLAASMVLGVGAVLLGRGLALGSADGGRAVGG